MVLFVLPLPVASLEVAARRASWNVARPVSTHARLEPGPLVNAIGPALLARAKGTVKTALALIDRAAHRSPELRGRAAIVAIDALAHESPAVHEAVLKLIELHGDRNDPALVELLKSRAESVAPSQRVRLTSWLGSHSAPKGPDTAAAELDELLTRASLIDPRLAELAGIPAAIELLTARGGEIRAIDFPELNSPGFTPAGLSSRSPISMS
jgi:hypothetical protein